MSNYIDQKRKIYCANCGKIGHEFRKCIEPITSIGIINFRVDCPELDENNLIRKEFFTNKNNVVKIISNQYPNLYCYYNENFKIFPENKIRIFDNIHDSNVNQLICQSADDIKKFCYYKEKVKFLMVSRRFSLGYVEFIRGKYETSDVDGIIKLFEQMTESEIKNLSKYDYDTLLYQFLNRDNENKITVLSRVYDDKKYSSEYFEAKLKFNELSNASWDNGPGTVLNLNFYTRNIKPKWIQAEWGFPKGRRNKKDEDNLICASREFEEETGYTSDEYTVLNRIDPVEENLIGTNGVNYKHIYYLSLDDCDVQKNIGDLDYFEIGDIGWVSYDDAMKKIRPYHLEKKQILTHIFLFIMNFLIHYDERKIYIG